MGEGVYLIMRNESNLNTVAEDLSKIFEIKGKFLVEKTEEGKIILKNQTTEKTRDISDLTKLNKHNIVTDYYKIEEVLKTEHSFSIKPYNKTWIIKQLEKCFKDKGNAFLKDYSFKDWKMNRGYIPKIDPKSYFSIISNYDLLLQMPDLDDFTIYKWFACYYSIAFERTSLLNWFDADTKYKHAGQDFTGKSLKLPQIKDDFKVVPFSQFKKKINLKDWIDRKFIEYNDNEKENIILYLIESEEIGFKYVKNPRNTEGLYIDSINNYKNIKSVRFIFSDTEENRKIIQEITKEKYDKSFRILTEEEVENSDLKSFKIGLNIEYLYFIETIDHKSRLTVFGVKDGQAGIYSCELLKKLEIPFNPYNIDLNNKRIPVTYIEALDFVNQLGGFEK